jgi:hypothetical protein
MIESTGTRAVAPTSVEEAIKAGIARAFETGRYRDHGRQQLRAPDEREQRLYAQMCTYAHSLRCAQCQCKFNPCPLSTFICVCSNDRDRTVYVGTLILACVLRLFWELHVTGHLSSGLFEITKADTADASISLARGILNRLDILGAAIRAYLVDRWVVSGEPYFWCTMLCYNVGAIHCIWQPFVGFLTKTCYKVLVWWSSLLLFDK